MAFEANRCIIPGLVAAGDLSSDQFRFMVVDSNGEAVKNTAAGGIVDGVLQDKPDAQGKTASVQDAGVTKVVAGGTVAAGDLVMSDAGAAAIVATATNYYRGRALEGGASGDLISVNLRPHGYLAA